MAVLVRLVLGIVGLLFVAFAGLVAGFGGIAFAVALILVIVWAFSARRY